MRCGVKVDFGALIVGPKPWRVGRCVLTLLLLAKFSDRLGKMSMNFNYSERDFKWKVI